MLLSCGVSRTPGARSLNTAWPVPAPNSDFLPIGPWNTQGLVVATPLRSEERSRYIQKLRADGFPLLFIGSGEEGPAVLIDNEGGIRQAVEHLVKHGHRRIAFIAGDPADSGDSTQRLRAFHKAVEDFDVELDPRLIAYGYHYQDGGRRAMEQVLSLGAAFTAVVASNDMSACGAMEALRNAGRRIPADVAVIGFDDQSAAAGQVPPLTSVHYPLYEVGVKAVELLLSQIDEGGAASMEPHRVHSWLTLRQSCGCSTAFRSARLERVPATAVTALDSSALTDAMAGAIPAGASHLEPEKVRILCAHLADAFLSSLRKPDPVEFQRALLETMQTVEEADDDAEHWHLPVTVLRAWTIPTLDPGAVDFAENLLHQARMAISECVERQNLRHSIELQASQYRLGWMAARMFGAGTEQDIVTILTDSLPKLGIAFGQLALFEKTASNPYAGIRFYRTAERPTEGEPGILDRGICCTMHDFPPHGLFVEGERYSMALLPLAFQADPIGFLAFDAANLEPLATIARQMSVALHNVKIQNRIDELSLTDPLTGLPNRRFLDLILGREMDRSRRYSRPVAVLLADVDNFQEYNELHGWLPGNEVLQSISQFVFESARRGTDFAGRSGDDEFVLLLPETEPEGAQEVAKTILESVRTHQPDGKPYTISIGIGISLAGDKDKLSVLGRAERSLYQAKSRGGDRVGIPFGDREAN